jgi:ketosteroid isomerase-like protein
MIGVEAAMQRFYVFAVMTALILPSTSAAQPSQEGTHSSDPQQQIADVEEQRRQAVLHNDIDALQRLLAPEFTSIYMIFGSKVGTKADELALNGAGSRKVESWKQSEVNIRVYSNVGLVTGLAEIVDRLNGDHRHVRVRYTHVWVKHDGRWQLVHRHTNRVATLEGPAPK